MTLDDYLERCDIEIVLDEVNNYKVRCTFSVPGYEKIGYIQAKSLSLKDCLDLAKTNYENRDKEFE